MSDGDLTELYQAIILDHNRHPRHYGRLEAPTHSAEGYNPLCGDKVTVDLRIEDDEVRQIGFEAACCAICKASASLMAVDLLGRSLSEAEDVSRSIHAMLAPGAPDPDLGEAGDRAALAGVRRFPARIKCATLPWRTFEAARGGEAKTVIE